MGQGNSDKSEPDLQPATPKYTDGWLDEIMQKTAMIVLKVDNSKRNDSDCADRIKRITE